jgi:hypothetical protein
MRQQRTAFRRIDKVLRNTAENPFAEPRMTVGTPTTRPAPTSDAIISICRRLCRSRRAPARRQAPRGVTGERNEVDQVVGCFCRRNHPNSGRKCAKRLLRWAKSGLPDLSTPRRSDHNRRSASLASRCGGPITPYPRGLGRALLSQVLGAKAGA